MRGSLSAAAQTGGAANQGTIYEFGPYGTFKLLYSMAGSDGNGPADLLQQNKAVYGTAFAGGTNAYGTVFRLKR